MKSEGISFSNPNKNIDVNRVMDGFIDDTTCWVNDFKAGLEETMDTAELTGKLQRTAQWWEELLTATGGKLELSKCFYYIIRWTFDSDGNPAVDTNLGPEIRITDHTTQQEVKVPQKKCDEAHRTLGGFLNPARLSAAAIIKLRKKVRELHKAIRSGSITRKEGFLMPGCVYSPSTRYGMHVTISNDKTLDKIQAPIIAAILNSMGYNSHFPKAMRHGPMELGGAGILDLKTIHGSTKAQHILQHIRINRSTGQTMRIAVDWVQQLIGTSTPLLEEKQEIRTSQNHGSEFYTDS